MIENGFLPENEEKIAVKDILIAKSNKIGYSMLIQRTN
jgi:hypothetical protein